MFKKILIANRGEIACRVIKTARRMGVKTVAVYSDADSRALHVAMADEAVFIGGAAAAESYLRGEKILEAARQTGAEALHPGYGFLSENADFARDCEREGIAFIGPNAEAIARMGDKIESKILAKKAGVSTIPGHQDALTSADEIGAIAETIGYPVMIKAAAGGGGKGMRIARQGDNLVEAAASARREAEASFGDGRVFVEKYIENPRHIEIQILCDKRGAAVHLGERECSIQRRNQKIIEEAPSPLLNKTMREAMGREALLLAKAVGYDSAGTVEFVVGRDKVFYFLEMNTRLQVEHPVSELITGLDLAEEMIRIAADEPLRLTQNDVRFTGWAFEARLCAEDPERGFLPQTGTLSRCRPPDESQTVRIDSGVEEGDAISVYYDPMIMKLCSWGEDRESARKTILSALERLELEGFPNNRLFLSAIFAHKRFAAGDLSTSFIEEEYPQGFKAETEEEVLRRDSRAVALFAEWQNIKRARQEAALPLRARMPKHLAVMEGETREEFAVSEREGGLAYGASVYGAGRLTRKIQSDWRFGARLFHGQLDGRTILMQIRRSDQSWILSYGGARFVFRVMSPLQAALEARLPKREASEKTDRLLCPMPGQLVKLHVKAGDRVEAGQPLAVVEAMKMENILFAEQDAVVKEIFCEEGQSLALDDPILRFG